METKHLTVMFTDIKGFTKRTSLQSRQKLNEFLRIHDDLLKPVFEKYNGRVVKTIGDAFLTVFEAPTDAVLCGKKIQEVLKEHNEKAPKSKQLEVRVAINTGEVNIRENDVFGEPVNVAARIEGIAKPNRVYFTEAVYLSMNKSEVPSAHIGETRLRGIPDTVKLYCVLPDENRSEFMKKRKRMLEAPKTPKKSNRKFYIFLIVGVMAILVLTGGFVVIQKAPVVAAGMWDAALSGDWGTVYSLLDDIGARVTAAVTALGS